MDMSALLVHSPLLGPSSWGAVAAAMGDRGIEVAVPDLTVVARSTPPHWERLVNAAVAGADGLSSPITIVGHSGAGVFLPAITGRLGGRVGALVFVDAVVPPASGMHRTPERLRVFLDAQTVDGRLRPWLRWWPDEVVAELLPDMADRTALLEDMPSLPRTFHDEAVPVPDGWSDGPCAYLKLSAAYDADADKARAHGWAHTELHASHLAILTQPNLVVDAVTSLLRDLPPG